MAGDGWQDRVARDFAMDESNGGGVVDRAEIFGQILARAGQDGVGRLVVGVEIVNDLEAANWLALRFLQGIAIPAPHKLVADLIRLNSWLVIGLRTDTKTLSAAAGSWRGPTATSASCSPASGRRTNCPEGMRGAGACEGLPPCFLLPEVVTDEPGGTLYIIAYRRSSDAAEAGNSIK